MRYNIKARLAILGKTQVWLIGELAKRGEKVNAPELSNYRSGAITTPKGERVLAMCDQILKELERN